MSTVYEDLLVQQSSFVENARKSTHNHHDAEDVFGEMCVTLVRNPKTYLGIIYNSRVRDFIRRKKLRKLVCSTDFDEGEFPVPDKRCQTPQENLINKESAALVHQSIKSLHPLSAYIIWTFFIDGKSIRHISQRTGLNSAAVRMKIWRAKQKLRKILCPPPKSEKD